MLKTVLSVKVVYIIPLSGQDKEDKDDKEDEMLDDLPELPAYTPETANLCQQSMNILQKGRTQIITC